MLGLLADLPLPVHRPTPVDQVHMTVHFIGDTPDRQLEEVRESVRRSCSGASEFAILPRRLITLPERGPARLLACRTDLPASLAEIRRRLVLRLARNAKERDRFTPHLTLCRFRAPVAGLSEERDIQMPAWKVREVRLMRSVLSSQSAHHVLDTACPLVPAPGTGA